MTNHQTHHVAPALTGTLPRERARGWCCCGVPDTSRFAASSFPSQCALPMTVFVATVLTAAATRSTWPDGQTCAHEHFRCDSHEHQHVPHAMAVKGLASRQTGQKQTNRKLMDMWPHSDCDECLGLVSLHRRRSMCSWASVSDSST